jgi:hypothetical protein
MASPGTRATASACARSNRVTAATLARAMSRTSMSTDQAMGLALGGQAGARRHGPQAPLWGSGEHERFCLEKLLAAAITLIF